MQIAKLKLIVILFSSFFGLSACSTRANHMSNNGNMPAAVLPTKVTAIGYGAMPVGDGLSSAQRHLLAMRAAKLDAYRALAETVSGIKITGSSTVSAMALTNDSYKAYIEAYMRGARIVSITPLPDGAFETVLELTLGGDFYRAAPESSASAMQEVTPSPTPITTSQLTPIKVVPQAAAVKMKPSQNYYLSL